MGKEVDRELLPLIRVYKDGSVERLTGTPHVPPSPDGDADTGVLSKDITISHDPLISARIYLPKDTPPGQKLPVLFYCHGGGFCIESAFSLVETKYLNSLVSQARVVAVSVEYRLAPEHPLPAAFHDCWAALQWVATATHSEPWLNDHADLDRLYVGGDSAGATLAHYVLVRAGAEGLPRDVTVSGAYLTHPYFWGSEAVGDEPTAGKERDLLLPYLVWMFLYPSASGGIDNPMINPLAPGAASLAGLGCRRLLVSVAGEDELKSRGVWFYEGVKKSGWKGEVELIEVEGEEHAFHILNYDTKSAHKLIARLASFLK